MDDPYRPDATPDDRADHIIGAILADEDAVRRYQTIQALQGGRLRDAAAITLRELRVVHGTTEAAAAAVGISRQAMAELLAKAGAPGAREDRGVLDTPAYAYGVYLASVRDVAEQFRDETARHRAIQRWYDLELKATASTAGFVPVTQAGMEWVRRLRRTERRPAAAERAERRMDACAEGIADWITECGDNHQLTLDEQAAAWIGTHHGRARYRREREANREPSTD